jgi:small subunit ribosomal protein S16e
MGSKTLRAKTSGFIKFSCEPLTFSTFMEFVNTFGRKKTAVAVVHCKRGKGLLKVNGSQLNLMKPDVLALKVFEPIHLLGAQYFSNLDIRIRTKGGGHVSQVFAIRQAIAKALLAFHQKFVDEETRRNIKERIMSFDRSLLVADYRRCEPKMFGGRGARARFQKSYR